MEFKGTKGEWKQEVYRSVNTMNGMIVIHNGEKDFAYVEDYSDPYNEVEKEANAKLIAAAPEMLFALKEARRELENLSKELVLTISQQVVIDHVMDSLIGSAIKKALEK